MLEGLKRGETPKKHKEQNQGCQGAHFFECQMNVFAEDFTSFWREVPGTGWEHTGWIKIRILSRAQVLRGRHSVLQTVERKHSEMGLLRAPDFVLSVSFLS